MDDDDLALLVAWRAGDRGAGEALLATARTSISPSRRGFTLSRRCERLRRARGREHLRVRLGADVVFPVESADLRRRLDATRRPVADLTPEKPAE